jgi:hypothetical protein
MTGLWKTRTGQRRRHGTSTEAELWLWQEAAAARAGWLEEGCSGWGLSRGFASRAGQSLVHVP